MSKFFPDASIAFELANPQLSTRRGQKNATTGNVERRRGIMNKTEAEFALKLEAKKRAGEILRYEFEGITLRWADMRYTPDFLVIKMIPIDCESCGKTHSRLQTYLRFIEVKGGHVWDRDVVRFKGARAHWPEFSFEMHQKTKQGWKRIH